MKKEQAIKHTLDMWPQCDEVTGRAVGIMEAANASRIQGSAMFLTMTFPRGLRLSTESSERVCRVSPNRNLSQLG